MPKRIDRRPNRNIVGYRNPYAKTDIARQKREAAEVAEVEAERDARLKDEDVDEESFHLLNDLVRADRLGISHAVIRRIYICG